MNIVYVIMRQGGKVERITLPFPTKPKLRKNDRLLRILVPEDCPLFAPDRRVKAEVYVGRKRIR